MAKRLPYPARQIQQDAADALALTAIRERLSKPETWLNPPEPPERLGNMLQQLARKRPAAVVVLENLVAEMLVQSEGNNSNRPMTRTRRSLSDRCEARCRPLP